jgi:hypothetical protein
VLLSSNSKASILSTTNPPLLPWISKNLRWSILI